MTSDEKKESRKIEVQHQQKVYILNINTIATMCKFLEKNLLNRENIYTRNK